MASDLLARADRAFVEEEFESAVQLYSQALEQTPNSASIYESRAHAHIKAGDFLEAANDAAKAIELEPSLAKAYLRRGIALFNLDEYEAAKAAFEDVQRLDPSNAQCKKWIRKCEAELDEEGDSAEVQTAKFVPEPVPAAVPAATGTVAQHQTPASMPSSSASTMAVPAGMPTFDGKYRHQYYQLQNRVTVDVYAKNKKHEDVTVEFSESHLLVSLKDDSGSQEYTLEMDLYGKVIPSQCKYEVLKTKIEITMIKADNVQWGSLEKSTKLAAPNYSTPGATAPTKFPSSAKNAKDWDKVESELAQLEGKGDLDDGDPLNNFFKKIFSHGDEDTRRAMMKSFVESNGTVLSTNWTDVGSKIVECTPPDGMEAKKWES